jgi:hypothetical protein
MRDSSPALSRSVPSILPHYFKLVAKCIWQNALAKCISLNCTIFFYAASLSRKCPLIAGFASPSRAAV